MVNTKKIFFCTVLLAPLFFHIPLAAQDLKDISQRLDGVVEAAMKERSIPGVQLALFSPEDFLVRSYGYADVKKNKITQETLFQAGALVRPLTAYVALKTLIKTTTAEAAKRILNAPIATKVNGLRIVNSSKEAISLHHLLTMTSGLPVFHLGLLDEKGELSSQKQSALKYTLHTEADPGAFIQMASQNYAYLARLAGNSANKDFIEMAQQKLQSMGLMNTCILARDCKSIKNISQPLTSVGDLHFQMPQVKFLFPTADSLFTNASDYAHFLRKLWKQSKRRPTSAESHLFRKHFRYDARLGGMGYGFSFSLPIWYKQQSDVIGEKSSFRENVMFYIESSLPGYSALAFISDKGIGAVILINKDDLFFLRILQRSLYEFYALMSNEKSYVSLSSKIDETLGGKSLIDSLHQTALREKKPHKDRFVTDNDSQGSYRPLASTPRGYKWLDFLNELQLRHTKQGIELSSVFEKEVFVRLYPLAKDLYIARGIAKIDGWRVLVRRNSQGEVIGLDTDLIRYERIPKILSAWSILIALGILAGLPVFIPLFYFILLRKS